MGRRASASTESYPIADEAILKPFIGDLRLANDNSRRSDLIRKHITTGDPRVLSPDVYFELRRRISARFGIHPSSVVLAGSCKLGFSLKPKGPHNGPRRRFVAVSPASDVDVAVVSQKIFDELWDAVFASVYPKRDWSLDIGRTFTRDLFNGWIDPSTLPNTPTFSRALEWSRFFDELNQSRLCDLRTVHGRLYRSWDRLEAYQDHMVRDCHSELIREQT
jgi:hypothetical protein